ncbi:MAG: tyrosine-protein phosphatase [Thermoleophilia bacterium]
MRHLPWAGCCNVRDLGGLPTEDGRTTRPRVVVRADDISALDARGWDALATYGVRTAIDLRFVEEGALDPPHADRISVVRVSLFGRIDRGAGKRIDRLASSSPDPAQALEALYVDALEVHAGRIARAVDELARALSDGAVVVHCAIGKDRTGIVAALLLRLAGVSPDDVADDYALSHERVEQLVGEWIAAGRDEEQRAARARLCAAPRDGMVGTLAVLEERYGGARRYLRDAGVAAPRLDELRGRLVG